MATPLCHRVLPPLVAPGLPVSLPNCSPNAALQLRYANNSNYKNDTMIRKECFVSQAVLDELKRIIEDSEVRGRPSSTAAAAPHA